MFLFSRNRPEDEMKRAKAAYEKAISLTEDTREARSMKMRMGLLCRAHVDKTFVAGAELTAAWQEKAGIALANSEPIPDEPQPSRFQKIKSGESEIYVYLPEELAQDIFLIGAKYQRMQMTAQQAIDAVQGIVNQLCRYELGLEEPFQALTFLRDELEAQARAEEEAALQLQAQQNGASETGES
jgi:hypothetical protein